MEGLEECPLTNETVSLGEGSYEGKTFYEYFDEAPDIRDAPSRSSGPNMPKVSGSTRVAQKRSLQNAVLSIGTIRKPIAVDASEPKPLPLLSTDSFEEVATSEWLDQLLNTESCFTRLPTHALAHEAHVKDAARSLLELMALCTVNVLRQPVTLALAPHAPPALTDDWITRRSLFETQLDIDSRALVNHPHIVCTCRMATSKSSFSFSLTHQCWQCRLVCCARCMSDACIRCEGLALRGLKYVDPTIFPRLPMDPPAPRPRTKKPKITTK